MKSFVLGGIMVLFAGVAEAGPAQQIAGNAASIIGAAPACGISADRVSRTSRDMRQDVADRAAGPEEKAKVLEMYDSGLQRAAEKQAGPDKEDCTDIVNGFGTMEGAARSLHFVMPH